MIDTIVIKLHHVSKYTLTKTKFEADSIKGETTVLVNDDTGLLDTNTKVRAIMYHDSDSIIPLTKRSNYLIPSSHYLLSYFYKVTDDSVEFNFSIPKYLFGTNIFQFVPYFDQSSDSCFQYFKEFIQDFITSFFPEKIDLSDIELNRIDLCYNQFFQSKNDALRYLDAQKELLVKYARSSKNKFKTWDTSFMYVTGRYSFKIYHKGEEFKKKDKMELIKRNPKGYNIADLGELSDRILRYEITFRKSMLNYLFKDSKMEDIYFPFNLSNHDETARFRARNKQHFEYCIDFQKNSKTFFLNVDPWNGVVNMFAEFDKQLFGLCFDFFWNYVNKFQLEPKKSIKEIQENIDQMNADVELKNKFNRKQDQTKEKSRLTMLALLAQEYPMETLRTMQIIPQSTYYRYMKELKQIGVITENRMPVSVPKPSLDYLDYKYYFGRYHLK